MGCGCSAPEEGPMNPNQVDQSHFTMMKVVGKGGFGKVNAVQHRTTNMLMAMKRMKKSKLVSKKMYVITAWRERDVMACLRSPFLVNLLYAFQDPQHLFLVMPFMQGGDLRFYLTTRGKMSEEMCRFYAAEIILGLEELHQKNIVYRDLKPDNVLLDSTGHLRISDFGLAVFLRKDSGYRVSGGAGTPGYQAPEVLNKQKYGTSADIWSLGITIYELIERLRPFTTPEESLTQERVHFHHQGVTREAKDLIRRMLEKDPNKRLGCGPNGIEDIKNHKWFASVDWVKMNAREVKPPFLPELGRANCSADYELQDQFFSEKKEPDLTEQEQLHFKGYEFGTEIKGPLTLPPKKNRPLIGSDGVMVGEIAGEKGATRLSRPDVDREPASRHTTVSRGGSTATAVAPASPAPVASPSKDALASPTTPSAGAPVAVAGGGGSHAHGGHGSGGGLHHGYGSADRVGAPRAGGGGSGTPDLPAEEHKMAVRPMRAASELDDGPYYAQAPHQPYHGAHPPGGMMLQSRGEGDLHDYKDYKGDYKDMKPSMGIPTAMLTAAGIEVGEGVLLPGSAPRGDGLSSLGSGGGAEMVDYARLPKAAEGTHHMMMYAAGPMAMPVGYDEMGMLVHEQRSSPPRRSPGGGGGGGSSGGMPLAPLAAAAAASSSGRSGQSTPMLVNMGSTGSMAVHDRSAIVTPSDNHRTSSSSSSSSSTGAKRPSPDDGTDAYTHAHAHLDDGPTHVHVHAEGATDHHVHTSSAPLHTPV